MIIDINDLENDKATDIEIDEYFEELKAHASGMLTIKLLGDFIFIKGNLDVNIELECSRCLKIFETVINVNIDEKFYKGVQTPEYPKERQLKSKDFVEELTDCEEIDLSDLIYQSIILNIPSQVLCDENCEGTEELKKYIKADENIQTIEIPLKVKNNNK